MSIIKRLGAKTKAPCTDPCWGEWIDLLSSLTFGTFVGNLKVTDDFLGSCVMNYSTQKCLLQKQEALHPTCL